MVRFIVCVFEGLGFFTLYSNLIGDYKQLGQAIIKKIASVGFKISGQCSNSA